MIDRKAWPVLLACIVAWCSGVATAETYYVDGSHPAASDRNLGTESAPWKTIHHAARVLQAGDTVLVKQGEYDVGASPNWAVPAVGPSNAGTKDAPIVFRAATGERVVVRASGGQAAIGSNQDYVVWDGFIVDMADRMKGILISGATGCVVRFCEVIGNEIDTGDNHDGIRIERAPDCHVHHNVVHHVLGGSTNSAAVKIYSKGAKHVLVEDNYIHDNIAGIFDKDFGVDNTFRRNYCTRNRLDFNGNNQGGIARYFIHDNVFDGQMSLHAANAGTEVHDNLFRSARMVESWAGGVKDTRIWNNIVLAGKDNDAAAISILACENKKQTLESAVGYMDDNLYNAPPTYLFGQYINARQSLSLEQMRAEGFETNSHVVGDADEIFEDMKSFQLLPKWRNAGRNSDQPGPNNIAEILDLTRYGPSAPGRQESRE